MTNNISSKFAVAGRVLLGLVFVVFGLNGFLGFLPQPPPPPAGGAYLGGLAASGYFFPVLKSTEILVGLALLSGLFVPLALVVLAPITVHIALYHTLLDPAGFPLAAFVLVAHLYLAWVYRDAFRGVLAARAQPRSANQAGQRFEVLGTSRA